MSYNVNAIVGKYIMPVTIYTEYCDVKLFIKKGIDVTTGKEFKVYKYYRAPRNIRIYRNDVVNDNTFKKLDKYAFCSDIHSGFTVYQGDSVKGKTQKYHYKKFHIFEPYHCLYGKIDGKIDGKIVKPDFLRGEKALYHLYCGERKNVAYPYACKRGYNKVVDLFNKLLDRYKPTSKYYMAFARISEFFY